MKLLSKQQVNIQVATQKKAQIDEGIMIAKKVDVLRQTLSELQKQHSLFLQGMESELKQKTEKLVQDITEKEEKIKELEIKRIELIRPLDEEWNQVKDQAKELQRKSVELEQEKQIIDTDSKRIEEKLRKTSEILSHTKIRERELIKVCEKEEENKKETERIKNEIIEQKTKQDKHFETKDKEFNEREKSITSYEFTLKAREEQIEIKEKEIEEEKIRLLDQRSTLERAIKRLNK